MRKIQLSIKLPPDIEKKIRAAVDNGEYTNTTDAITGILRLYFQNNKSEKIIENLESLKSDVDVLKMRIESLEKKVCEKSSSQ